MRRAARCGYIGRMIRGDVRAISGRMPRLAPSVAHMFRRLTPRQFVTDLGIAALCVLLRSSLLGYDSTALALVALGMGIALALRRLSPGLALIVAWIFALGQMLSMQSPDVANGAILLVLYATARYGREWVKWAGLISAVLGAFVSTMYVNLTPYLGAASSGGGSIGELLGTVPNLLFATVIGLVAALAVLGLSWTAGLLVRTRVDARESRLRQLAAERDATVAQERNRIARDMHDIVAHSLAVVIAQADGARYAGAADPRAVDGALLTIASTAREALSDVRMLLGQLRHRQEAGPQPALVDLDRLLDQLRASGLVVDLVQRGDPIALPAAQQLALYRIAQETLTNALRHGDVDREVEATIDWSPDAATLTVTNAVANPQQQQHLGHGLAGMRERALLVGGTFAATHVGENFVVRASIPVAAS